MRTRTLVVLLALALSGAACGQLPGQGGSDPLIAVVSPGYPSGREAKIFDPAGELQRILAFDGPVRLIDTGYPHRALAVVETRDGNVAYLVDVSTDNRVQVGVYASYYDLVATGQPFEGSKWFMVHGSEPEPQPVLLDLEAMTATTLDAINGYEPVPFSAEAKILTYRTETGATVLAVDGLDPLMTLDTDSFVLPSPDGTSVVWRMRGEENRWRVTGVDDGGDAGDVVIDASWVYSWIDNERLLAVDDATSQLRIVDSASGSVVSSYVVTERLLSNPAMQTRWRLLTDGSSGVLTVIDTKTGDRVDHQVPESAAAVAGRGRADRYVWGTVGGLNGFTGTNFDGWRFDHQTGEVMTFAGPTGERLPLSRSGLALSTDGAAAVGPTSDRPYRIFADGTVEELLPNGSGAEFCDDGRVVMGQFDPNSDSTTQSLEIFLVSATGTDIETSLGFGASAICIG